MHRPRPALRLRSIALWMTVAVVPVSLMLDDPTAEPAAITLVGHEVLGVERKSYPPAHAGAWEEDIGLHAVSVIAGTLTVHSVRATPVSYGPGQGYVAGWAPYRAVNAGSVPVEVVVTRLARRHA